VEFSGTPEPRENSYCSDPDTAFEEVSALGEEEAHEQVRNLRAAIQYHDHPSLAKRQTA
jgi:DNA ligase (NAD+)